MPQVEWSVLAGEMTEKVVSHLLFNEHQGAAVPARPSQGDYGIDVLVPIGTTAEAFHVYQIKRFAQNLTDNEKRQIEKSFRRFVIGIARHQVPAADWDLVMPLDPTIDNHLKWFGRMPGDVIGGDVRGRQARAH